MRRIFRITLCFLSLSVLTAQAQKERIQYKLDFDKKTFYWGYYLGLNFKDYRISYNDNVTFIDSKESAGFNIGLIGGWNPHKNISLRLEPGISSNTKELVFTNIPGGARDSIREVESSYLHIPLVVKFNTNRMGNIRPYFVAGISYDRNLKSNEDNPNDNNEGEFRMKTNNFGYEMGFGIDIYMPYFIFSPSIRGSFIINNEVVYDKDPNSPWTGPIDKMQTRGVFLNLAFH